MEPFPLGPGNPFRGEQILKLWVFLKPFYWVISVCRGAASQMGFQSELSKLTKNFVVVVLGPGKMFMMLLMVPRNPSPQILYIYEIL